MKKIIAIIAAILMTASVFAQSPNKMSYQAVVRDGSNNLVSSTPVGMQISILQGSSSGTAVYVETQAPTSNANGLVSIEIGAGTVVSGTFATIDWANGPYFVKTETDPTGGTTYTITGTSQLLSVPYTLHSKTAENVINDLVDDADADPANEIQNVSDVLVEGNDAGNNSLVNLNTLTIGSSTSTLDAALEINSTTGSLLLPRMTTAQRDLLSPQEGMMIYNTDTNKFQGYSVLSGPSSLDQSQQTYNSTAGSGTWQEFVAGSTGNLTNVKIHTQNSVAGLTISIYDGTGTGGTLLHSQTFTSIAGGSSGSWINETNIVLSSAVAVIGGNSYTISISNSSSWHVKFGGNPYATGVSSFGVNDDFSFETYIAPFSTEWIDLH